MNQNNQIFVPDFVKIQRDNFQRFLETGIIKEINAKNPIVQEETGTSLIFYPEYYQLCPPEGSVQDAMITGNTYACRLYIPGQLIDSQTKTTSFQWILLGTLPLMNRRGHFILNGSPRVIINQMVRSPGIYYSESVDRKGRKTVYGDLISQRGTWLRFEIDGENKTYVRMKRTPKIPIPLLLNAMGLTTNLLVQRLSNNSWFKNSSEAGYQFTSLNEVQRAYRKQTNGVKKNYSSQEWALISLYALVYPKRDLIEITPDMGRAFLFRKFLNPRTYDLGYLGRFRLNKRFNISTPLGDRILTTEDILKITEYLFEVFNGTAPVDDIDHLKNRRIRSSGELIQNQLALGLTRFEKVVRERLRRTGDELSLSNLVTTKPLNAAFREFFGSSQLSQFLDQTNPLAEITHKRRFTSLGPSGVSRETAGMAIRSIHPTHYGRICPIETPEGQNAGLVNSPTIFTRINENGFLESPFFPVLKGQTQGHLYYLTADQEENAIVAPGDIQQNKYAFLANKNLPIRSQQEFSYKNPTKIQYLAISALQMISVATSLIPFLEHDDANRALMGSNMQRQAVPLLTPERAIVGTGNEARVVSDSGHTINARYSGYVLSVSNQEIKVYSLVNTLTEQSTNILSSERGWSFKTITYKLQGISRSNQDTYLFERPLVQENQWIEKGDILADGSASASGELALGKNILIGYVPWEGYNFEDAILISDRLVKQDLYTSLHVEKYDIELKDTRFGEEKFTADIPDLPISSKLQLDNWGIIKLGSWVKENDILVGKVTPINQKPLSPHERLLYDIVGKDIRNVKNTSLRVPKGLSARVVNIRLFDTDGNCYERPLPVLGMDNSINSELPIVKVSILLAESRRVQVGDKMAGRHGNKGIVSRILPKYDMPYLPDGTSLDMVLNPLGIPSRMNVGQVYECLLGLAGTYLHENYKIAPFDEIAGAQVSRSIVYKKLYDASKKAKKPWLFNPNFPGKIKLFDGRTGEPFDQHVLVGYSYILKLVHQVDEKIHARSTGPYSLVTQQPLRGRSKHGGQRLGEMEVWALEGFGAAYTLQELLTVKSDDMKGRHQVMDSILTNVPMQLGTPESFKVLVRELQSLCLDIGVYAITEKGQRRQVDILRLP